MRFCSALSFLLFLPMIACAQVCPAPAFEKLSPGTLPSRDLIEVRPANLLRMQVPAGVASIVQGHDLLGLVYKDGHRLTVTIDDGYTLRGMSHTKPGPFLANALLGATQEGCEFLKGWSQVRAASYRATLANGPIVVFVFGGADRKYEFVAIHSGKPDVAIRGLVSGLERPAVEAILSTIAPN